MTSVLITGGAGFVGAQLALGLKAAGLADRVVAFDNLKRRGSELNLPRLREGGIEFVHGDIRVPADLEVVGPIDWLLECSAEPSVQAGYNNDPRYVTETNLTGTLHCLEHARRHEAAVLFLSTSRVYPITPLRNLHLEEGSTRLELSASQNLHGVSEKGISESFPLEGHRSLYGATKLASELLLTEYGALYGLPYVINRCGILAGPWQMGKVDQGVVVLWAARHLFGDALRYIGFGGTGKQVRDMLHIDDLCDLVFAQIQGIDTISGQTFNVGGGRPVSASLLELTQLCADLTGRRIEIASEPETHPSDIPLYLSDTTRIEELMGWKATRSTEVILEDIVGWLKAHERQLRPLLS